MTVLQSLFNDDARSVEAKTASQLAELQQRTLGFRMKTAEAVRRLKQEKLNTLRFEAMKIEVHKACWRAVSTMGPRNLLPLVYPKSLCFYDKAAYPGVQGSIALTVDDAPCSRSDERLAMIREVQELLREYEAKATFFVCTDYVQSHESKFRELLSDGHEVANHCPADRSYMEDSEEAFEEALLRAERTCERLRRHHQNNSSDNENQKANSDDSGSESDDLGSSAMSSSSSSASFGRKGGRAGEGEGEGEAPVPGLTRWFRAPHAMLSSKMEKVLERHGFTNVLCDCYANDPWIPDATFVAENMLELAEDGSIAVIHMPERGFREYNHQALRNFLEGLRQRNIRVVTLSTLHAQASGGAVFSPPLEE
eukprot:CAMPEP_0206484390 /NCGR_PEP_ID=MMETSP0324_2-20121206/39948_1 /ASSEMBLY_ACC=CAM_ASM_000836 /TAXON_ID=2866 /ORGANISM="Crypthecodinium cohnii, Strain Seligo" /LENGTH=366 /DNA_ID=CAMNT_0053962533 /DNA_START=223 /DNA_END=1323 /DNA_ORIENTATION=-